MTESNLSPEFRPVISRGDALANGLKRYFTGKTCRRGHLAERETIARACLMCRCEDDKKRRAANKNKIVKYMAAYYKKNKEEIAKTKAVYRKKHEDKLVKYHAAYRKKHEDKLVKYRAAYYKNNKEKIAKTKAAWQAANPEIRRCIEHARRARKRNAEGRHTAADVQRIFDAQRGKCAHCLTGIKAGYHVDHIQPISRGGSNWPRNLQLLCAPCNQRKHAADPIDFARREGRLV